MLTPKQTTLLALPLCGMILVSACSSTSTSQNEETEDYSIVNMKTDSDEANLSADKSARYSVAEESENEDTYGETSGAENQQQQMEPTSMTFYFDFDSSELEGDGREKLQSLNMPTDGTLKVSIEGHADARGPEEYNRRLSRDRAEEVKSELSDALNTTQIEWDIQAQGESEPVSSNDSEWGRQRNRRVEVTIERADTEADRVGTL